MQRRKHYPEGLQFPIKPHSSQEDCVFILFKRFSMEEEPEDFMLKNNASHVKECLIKNEV